MARRPVASSAQKTTCSCAWREPGCGPNTVAGAGSGTAPTLRSVACGPCRSQLPNPYAAYLRVYEPLEAFPEADRALWVRYASSPTGAVARADRLVAEHRTALAGVISVPPRPVPSDEARDAFVLEVDGRAARLPGAVPAAVLGRARPVPGRPARHAAARLRPAGRRWSARTPTTTAGPPPRAGSLLRILTATWTVPIPWFVPFAAVRPGRPLRRRRRRCRRPRADRRPPDPMSAARRRVARALRTLRLRLGDGLQLDVADELEELGRWLEEFHPRSWWSSTTRGSARLLGADAGGRGHLGSRRRRFGGGPGGAVTKRARCSPTAAWSTAGRPSLRSSTPTDRWVEPPHVRAG